MKRIQRLVALGLVMMITWCSLPMIYANAEETKITVDGDITDWKNIPMNPTADDKAYEWGVYADGTNLYMLVQCALDQEWTMNKEVMVQYHGVNEGGFRLEAWSSAVKDAYNADIPNSSQIVKHAGRSYFEAQIPLEFFSSRTFDIEYYGIKASVVDGKTQVNAEPEPVYTGITIDGNYDDWKAITKTSIEGDLANYIASVASVFDGDYLYLYVKDSELTGANATNVQSHGNGMFCITSDTGDVGKLQFKADGTIHGIDNVESVHYQGQWELKIPKASLPLYLKSVSFGLYQGGVLIPNIVNLQEDAGTAQPGPSEEGSAEIVYDGLYGDWEHIKHTQIQYGTAGHDDKYTDGSAALYTEDTLLYGHVKTQMSAHNQGDSIEDMIKNVNLAFNATNGDYANAPYKLQMRLVTVDENGDINWYPSDKQTYGTHEYYIFDISAWGSSKNINELYDADLCYGKMMITSTETSRESEYYMDLEVVAKKFGCDASDFKVISAQYGRIGQEWVTISGASSGAFLGIALCIGAVVLVRVYRRRRFV